MSGGMSSPQHTSKIQTFQEACYEGNIDIAQVLAKYLSIEQIKSGNWAAFSEACKGGHMSIIQWLVDSFGVTNDIVNSTASKSPFYQACKKGHNHVLEWMFNNFTISNDTVMRSNIFRHVCGYGHYYTARWLVEKFNLSMAHIRGIGDHLHFDDLAFVNACSGGYLDIAQWYANITDMTRTDIRLNSNAALFAACRSDNVELVKWMVGHFKLQPKDSIRAYTSALQIACNQGNLDMAKYVTDCFEFTTQFVKTRSKSIAISFDFGRNIDIMKWMTKKFKIGIDDIRAYDNHVLKFICSRDIDTIAWVIGTFALTNDDLYNLFKYACIYGHPKTAKWLRIGYCANIPTTTLVAELTAAVGVVAAATGVVAAATGVVAADTFATSGTWRPPQSMIEWLSHI